MDALGTLKLRRGGEWWFLVVELPDGGGFLLARFADLRPRLEAEQFNLLPVALGELGDPLQPADVLNPAQAQDVLSPDGDLDVPDGPVVVAEPAGRGWDVSGVLDLSATRGVVAADGPTLFELAGLVEAGPGTPPPKAGMTEDEQPRREPPPARMAPDSSRDRSAPPKQEKHRGQRAKPPEWQPSQAPQVAAEEPPQPSERPILPLDGEMEESMRSFVDRAVPELNVDIDGSVEAGGTVNVAGGNIVYNLLSPEKQTKNQDRRFEAAFPHEVHTGEEVDLWVAVLLTDGPSPFGADVAKLLEDDAKSAAPVAFEVDAVTGELKPAYVDVSLTGKGFDVVGALTKRLTVWPDGRLEKRRFVVRAATPGAHQIIVEITQDGALLKEFTIAAQAFAPQTRPAGLLNLSLKIATFSLSFSFAGGAGV